jgi:hypothetical protein
MGTGEGDGVGDGDTVGASSLPQPQVVATLNRTTATRTSE